MMRWAEAGNRQCGRGGGAGKRYPTVMPKRYARERCARQKRRW